MAEPKVVMATCPQCSKRVFSTLQEPERLFDIESSKILTPSDDGLWGFVAGHVEHVCPEEGEEG